MSQPQEYQREFLQLAIDLGALKFGSFTLKSGRQSPYFFNAGVFSSGSALASLGRFYAEVIMSLGIGFDMLFGPAYKGIPLVAVTAASLADDHNIDVPIAYNRKEAKQHGEGGSIVGAPLSGKVLIIDDVITAGTAVRQAIAMIQQAGASVGGVILALDRQERGAGSQSAVQELAAELSQPVASIATLKDLIALVASEEALSGHLAAMSAYRRDYGV